MICQESTDQHFKKGPTRVFFLNLAEARGFDLSEAKDDTLLFDARSKSVAEARGFEPPRRLRAHTISRHIFPFGRIFLTDFNEQ